MKIDREDVSRAQEILVKVQEQRDAAAQHMNKADGEAFMFWSRIHRDLHMAQGSIESYLEWGV